MVGSRMQRFVRLPFRAFDSEMEGIKVTLVGTVNVAVNRVMGVQNSGIVGMQEWSYVYYLYRQESMWYGVELSSLHLN